MLETLSPREAGVIKMRYGLEDGQPKTLDDIGRVYGVTRERIRQIESKTMSKLRHPSRSQTLRDFLDQWRSACLAGRLREEFDSPQGCQTTEPSVEGSPEEGSQIIRK